MTLKTATACVFILLVCLMFVPEGEAECCTKHGFRIRDQQGNWHNGQVCGDCSKGTPYCSHGGCNMFGCNCDGGCRKGDCSGDTFPWQAQAGKKRSFTAEDIVRVADKDGDGVMSLAEGHAHLKRAGFPDHEIRQIQRSLRALDLDHDKFLTPQEIDAE